MNSLKVISIDGEEFQMTEDEILTVMTEYIKKKREWTRKHLKKKNLKNTICC